MQGKDIINSTLFQLLAPVFSEHIQNFFKKSQVDKYVKKLTAMKFFSLIIYAQLEQLSCLREISNCLSNQYLKKVIGIDSISPSQLSRKFRTLGVECAQHLFQDLIRKVGMEMGFKTMRKNLGRLSLIDASIISLCLNKYCWADFRSSKGGIKLHLKLKLFEKGVLPDAMTMTTAKKADRTQMDELITEDEDVMNVFDRAYVDYIKFDEYCDKGIRFASRLKKNALVDVIKEEPVNNEGPIKRDCTVILGKEGITKMKNPLRLVETSDTHGNEIMIITNDFDLSAEEIAEIYRNRWQIEIFFKWIKQHLHVKHFFGTGENAVELQLYIALCTYCLLTLINLKTSHNGPLLRLQRLLRACLQEPLSSFVKKLHKKPKHSSKGRRKINHERIFEETLQQVIEGESSHLDDLAYDPLIL